MWCRTPSDRANSCRCRVRPQSARREDASGPAAASQSQITTIHFLVTRPAPRWLRSTRLPFERHVYTLTAQVVLVRKEADQNFHLVLTASNGEHVTALPRRKAFQG